MAAPTSVTVDNLTGRWTMNPVLSDPYDAILKAQGVSWLTRKMLTAGTITLRIKQEVDDEGLTHLTIDSKSGTGLPGSTERRLLNNETRQGNHPVFGKITGRTRWAALDDLPSDWLATGWEDDTSRVILMTTEHLDIGAVTYQAGALELINGDRRYVRHVEVQKGEEQLKTKIIYDYLGPLNH